MVKVKLSSAKNLMVLLVQSSDHVTGLSGAALTITAAKDGGAFASITPTVTDRGSGWYLLALTAGHTDTLGQLALHITAASADAIDLSLEVVAYDPLAASNLGLTNLDATISSRSATGDAMSLTTAAMDAIMDRAAEGALTFRQLLRIVLAFVSGKANGAPTGPINFRDQADTKNRIVQTVDANGNRSSVTVDGT